jgi:hypothetical protein
MIEWILLFYLGIEIDAPWWYFVLLALSAVAKLVSAGIEIGEQMGGDDEYDC